MESRDLEILHWQGMFDSYIVNIFWKYVDSGIIGATYLVEQISQK